MAAVDPIWPTLDALDSFWQSKLGHKIEDQKSKSIASLTQRQVPGRPKMLIVGAVSDAVLAALMQLNPSCVFQAYPPAMGMRSGIVPALMMDTDLPPFARGFFDFIVVSHTIEYRSAPLALLSLIYEILQPQGKLLIISPHFLASASLKIGQGATFGDIKMRMLLRQAAFTPLSNSLIYQSRWRPAVLVHLAEPQVPPRPTGLRPIPRLWENFWRLRRPQGIAATGNSTRQAIEQFHD